mgnify:CR=1 FL=1
MPITPNLKSFNSLGHLILRFTAKILQVVPNAVLVDLGTFIQWFLKGATCLGFKAKSLAEFTINLIQSSAGRLRLDVEPTFS